MSRSCCSVWERLTELFRIFWGLRAYHVVLLSWQQQVEPILQRTCHNWLSRDVFGICRSEDLSVYLERDPTILLIIVTEMIQDVKSVQSL